MVARVAHTRTRLPVPEVASTPGGSRETRACNPLPNAGASPSRSQRAARAGRGFYAGQSQISFRRGALSFLADNERPRERRMSACAKIGPATQESPSMRPLGRSINRALPYLVRLAQRAPIFNHQKSLYVSKFRSNRELVLVVCLPTSRIGPRPHAEGAFGGF
ncbi:MAG: hypothetical protein BJ554DRAFT_5710 [Olpidium bornovanus]|uniref:Uncharacterized protein n=1 Tax=Olpidium bornovanus TaxID=278681 RepID=A0A8H7ZYX5_9FUNG|nr:MAG: hypothetical protein BJ554DRAFT_5710 [Olpidium bornovanus]